MFTVGLIKLSMRSSNAGAKSYVPRANCRRIHNLKKFLTRDKQIGACTEHFQYYESKPSSFYITSNVKCLSNNKFCPVRNYSTDERHSIPKTPKRENVFGELGGNRFDNIEMDEDELEEEKFTENEAKVPRSHRLTPGGYAALIKSHLQKKDLKSAFEVLDLAKAHRVPPTTYMYNLLLRACAVAGDFKKARSLYAAMKKKGLQCNGATYTSILNACAEYPFPVAIEYLENLRTEFAEKNVVLNDTHYNTMVKVYGKHGKIYEAFEIVDMMRDKRLPTDIVTFNHLLISAISNKDEGLRHALTIWHVMQRHRIKPRLETYNLLLRAIRDTSFGDLKVNDLLVDKEPRCQICLDDAVRPDLLAQQPTVNSLVFAEMKSEEIDNEKVKTRKSRYNTKLPAVTNSNDKNIMNIEELTKSTPLEDIRKKNRLILFGGLDGIFERMERDGITPDAKTATMLMDLAPLSKAAEDTLVKTLQSKKIPLDIDFYNMLMKKRSLRRDYEGAKEVIDLIQRSGLYPDIITWGILALSCHTLEDARTLIEGMNNTGYEINAVIAGTLIGNASRRYRFDYILEIMEILLEKRIPPNWTLYEALRKFETETKTMVDQKNQSRTTKHPAFRQGFALFSLRYPKWLKKMEQLEEDTLRKKVHRKSR